MSAPEQRDHPSAHDSDAVLTPAGTGAQPRQRPTPRITCTPQGTPSALRSSTQSVHKLVPSERTRRGPLESQIISNSPSHGKRSIKASRTASRESSRTPMRCTLVPSRSRYSCHIPRSPPPNRSPQAIINTPHPHDPAFTSRSSSERWHARREPAARPGTPDGPGPLQGPR